MTAVRIGPAAIYDVNGEVVFSEDDIDTPEDIEVYERALREGPDILTTTHPAHRARRTRRFNQRRTFTMKW